MKLSYRLMYVVQSAERDRARRYASAETRRGRLVHSRADPATRVFIFRRRARAFGASRRSRNRLRRKPLGSFIFAGGPRPSGLAACTGDPDSRPREAAGARTFIFRRRARAEGASRRSRKPLGSFIFRSGRSAARSGHYGKPNPA